MTYSLTSLTLVDTLKASAFVPNSGNAIFSITGERCASIAAHVPAHVATATAAAFNRAMQVKEADSGLVYTTDAGDWYIEPSPVNPDILVAQHQEYDCKGSTPWLSAEAPTLEALQDLIDDIVAEECCTECNHLVGESNVLSVTIGNDTQFFCKDCIKDISDREAGLREMADDDKAHAQREATS